MMRPARLDDLPQLLEIGQSMHAESPRFSRLRMSLPRLEGTLRQVLASQYGFAWVGEEQGRIYAVLIAAAGPHWCSDDLVACDLALYVEPARRGGITAARLVHRYRQWARDIGAVLREIGVTTGIHNEQTAALFEGIGFKRCGVLLED